MHVLLIDNEDSFTWNLWQLIRSLGANCDVRSKNAITIDQIKKMSPDRIVISPGPGHPKDAKLSNELLHNFQLSTSNFQPPILGVCLGHQCIATVFGEIDAVGHAPQVMHGKTSQIFHTGTGILSGVPSPFRAARYHSLIVKKLPEDFELLCWTPSPPAPLPLGEERKKQSRNDVIMMGMRHKTLPIVGVQFHPESFLTQYGERLMENFLDPHP